MKEERSWKDVTEAKGDLNLDSRQRTQRSRSKGRSHTTGLAYKWAPPPGVDRPRRSSGVLLAPTSAQSDCE
ncbi:hypothetical protein KIN20_002419 [Parelaphostrongylus tenuis]|uniref:Uncharacterized protein n=1 Tax=Parelaphostrongylus tenuis TaxID=148309 RepID=A0AAD5QHS2_PARTN|nr:hypothetical protein KIN20_002419 [Parelaphostrongylus tenuis]